MTSPSTLSVEGTTERPSFVGPLGAQLFTCLHLPPTPCDRLVVLCSSIGAEWKYNYRREVILARRLASAGSAAVRFHYLGTGNSDDGEITTESMLEDVARVARWATQRAGAAATLHFGSRFGALVAAAAGAATHAPLAVWSAPESGEHYFRELFRILRVGRVVGAGGAETASDPQTDLTAGRSVDVLGYTMHPTFHESARARSFDEALGAPPRAVKLVEIADRGQARPRACVRASAFTARGFDVKPGWVDEGRSWWFHDPSCVPEEERPAVGALVEETAQWLSTVAIEGSSR